MVAVYIPGTRCGCNQLLASENSSNYPTLGILAVGSEVLKWLLSASSYPSTRHPGHNFHFTFFPINYKKIGVR